MSCVIITTIGSKLLLKFSKELNVYNVQQLQDTISLKDNHSVREVEIDLRDVKSIDTVAAIFLKNLKNSYITLNKKAYITSSNPEIISTLELVSKEISSEIKVFNKESIIENYGRIFYKYYLGFLSFLDFLGNVFITKLHYFKSIKNIRFKEIAFEISESGIKAIPIILSISFLIGLVVAYQSAYLLKLYGANIFLVDMVSISLLRELAPLITAVVIAGRSGSSFTAQIGAMKITEELDAMKTMGFDPYVFLVIPKIFALIIIMPILIFFADIMGIIGAMVIANVDLNISPYLFLDRFVEVVDIKHFYMGILKGPFFAFLIATIGIYRGLKVQNDTQSIGLNTTKSVVESIFAVIICDSLFSIVFTNLGM